MSGLVWEAVKALGIEVVRPEIVLDHPADLRFGDYSTNIALKLGQKHNRNPKELAATIVAQILKLNNTNVAKVEVAGAGFINFYLIPAFYLSQLEQILAEGDNFGRNNLFTGKKVIVEYTDPNPFKLFHLGHLMSNTIGESIARLYDFSGAEMKRACYQGDVGMHVAKTIWSWQQNIKKGYSKNLDLMTPGERMNELGDFYAIGSARYEDLEKRKEIQEINKKIYDRSDDSIDKLYDTGRKWSLEYFDLIYKRLGTEFNFNFFESETGKAGSEMVEDGLQKGVFERSDGAVVFKGERYDLHTRVFLNSNGLPTYEAKELGLAKIKYETYPYDLSIVVTGNEINEYFIVLLKVMSLILPELAIKTKHVSHGMLRLPTGKMSSRTGAVIPIEYVINESKKVILEKMKETDREILDLEEVASQIAVGAIKYSILKQDIGKDIIFDFSKSLSFNGNSGPYLQYAYARTQSILAKASKGGIKPAILVSDEITNIERLLYRFAEVIERACTEYAPHHIATYLYDLASAFSSYYVDHQVVSQEANSPYRIALTTAVGQVLKNGLNLLGIVVPQKM